MERCGKRNASNSGAESWTGIGVVAGFGAVVLIMQWPHGKHRDVNWGSKLLQILQEVRSNCKTRNQLCLSLESVPPRLSGNPSIRRALVQGRRKVWIQERHGLYVPTMVLPIQPGSIEKLFEFIVKGLVWRHWQSYIAAEHFVEVEVLRSGEENLWAYYFTNIHPDLKVSANVGNGTFLY